MNEKRMMSQTENEIHSHVNLPAEYARMLCPLLTLEVARYITRRTCDENINTREVFFYFFLVTRLVLSRSVFFSLFDLFTICLKYWFLALISTAKTIDANSTTDGTKLETQSLCCALL